MQSVMETTISSIPLPISGNVLVALLMDLDIRHDVTGTTTLRSRFSSFNIRLFTDEANKQLGIKLLLAQPK